MPLNPTDLFVVQRGGKLYKAPSSELKIEYGSDAVVHVGENPPNNPEEGTLWWSTLEGNLFIWYDDGDSEQWVDASPAFVEIDYTRIEDYIDQSVRDNAVEQIIQGQDIAVTPSSGKGIVTISYDRTFLTEDQRRHDDALQDYKDEMVIDQKRQDDLINLLLEQIEDLKDRVDQLEDIIAGISNIDGGYPNAEGVFDEPETDGNEPHNTISDGGNAEGYV